MTKVVLSGKQGMGEFALYFPNFNYDEFVGAAIKVLWLLSGRR